MMKSMAVCTRLRLGVVLLVAVGMASCGKSGKQKYDTNLLVNGSFEDVGRDGIPTGWGVEAFRGPENEFAARYGVENDVVHDGQRAWFFAADPNTKRFFQLSQEVQVVDVTHVRLRGWIQTSDTDLKSEQFAQANFTITFFDENHTRFQEMRVADKRTRLVSGTRLWTEEDVTFRVPHGTRYVKVTCVLGMSGDIWFDNVSLEVPKPIDWETASTKNYVFHWLPGHPMPSGSQPSQQMIFDTYAKKMGVESDVVVHYYFYPDTATIRSMLTLKGYQYVSWDDREFHSINANDNHEVVHFITDPIGRPPRALAEGTVCWLTGEWQGEPIEDAMVILARTASVPKLKNLFDYNLFAMLDPGISMPAAGAFVAFLVDRFGAAKLMELYAAVNGMNSYEGVASGLEKVYGLPAADIEAAWMARLSMNAARK
jgi:hypothetical protein